MIKQLIDKLRGNKYKFHEICKTNNLVLNYAKNQSEINTLVEIFNHRIYATFFPFYQHCIVVDIGAHYGYFSLFAALNLAKESTIVAIEPNRNNFNNLLENCNNNGFKNIQCLNLAVSGTNGKANLYKGANINNSLYSNNPLSTAIVAEEVSTISLANLIRLQNLTHIDFLKIDCEGAEYEILEHTPKDVFDKITTISMEFHDFKKPDYTAEKIISKLQNNGFVIAKFTFDYTTRNLNYGKIIGTKLLR